jgi:hypothetical protein
VTLSLEAEAAILEFLGELETKEERLLAWGLTETEISTEEIQDYAQEFASSKSGLVTPEELIRVLVDRKVLFRFARADRFFFRTRCAETVRLLATLRQWLRGKDWRTAPTLVADYRLSLRRRTYPRRVIPAATFLGRLEADVKTTSLERDAMQALLGDRKFAEFQYRSTRRLLLDVRQRASRGMIVCAGTGTGKTLAFYLPALTSILPLIEKNYCWTKLIAIYPRNELLKDQMSEVFSLSRNLDTLAIGKRGRKISIGCFYGDTPKEATTKSVEDKKWIKHSGGTGYVCPFLRCPRQNCGAPLIWKRTDLERGIERLSCSDPNCGLVTEKDEIVLTRKAMQTNPPDVLFTSTEMLNRMISDSRYGPVFGVGAKAAPRLVLLDEIHTYSGSSGAQSALLLRRWQHAAKAQAQFAGLSATLRDAVKFFAQLTGIPEHRITHVAPGLDSPEEEMTEEGMEYRIALRGDPVSETATLSTTVQAAMLMRRILDPRDRMPSGGAFGRRVFAFCDDLDIVNRLYNILLDAEGWDRRGRAVRIPLAALRTRQNPQETQRFLNGQSWRLCEEIGHEAGLGRRLQVTRTSSQDPGVDAESDIVVATASLEVGYNDPEVGVVLQHKAPRDMASFLQRRGRAGRQRGMRPWTVVVLSDYGRDRTAYQAYDALFDPDLQPRYLPVSNRYVLRMQAVFALMDWFGAQIRETPGIKRGDVWIDFAQPGKGDFKDYRRPRQLAEVAIAERLLDGDMQLTASLETWLEKALKITRDEVSVLMWEPPRALMTEVLPTLARRLSTNWNRVPLGPNDSTEDYVWNGNPLPDFAPPNLFTDLNLPEVRVIVRQSAGAPEKPHSEPVLRAMQILAPGKVTRRFATERGMVCHWIPPRDLTPGQQFLELEAICSEFQDLGDVVSEEDGQLVFRRCIRPIEMKPQIVPQRVGSTSNAMLDWRSQIFAVGQGRPMDVHPSSIWAPWLPEIRCYIHNQHSHAMVRRFAIGSDVDLKGQGIACSIRLDFCESDRRPAAMGISQTVDGIRFRVRLPDDFRLDAGDLNRTKIRAYRAAYFRHRVLSSVNLGPDINRFTRERLCDVYLATLLAHALENGYPLARSNDIIQNTPQGRAEPSNALDVMFQTLDADVDDEDEEDSDQNGKQLGRMHKRLLALLADDGIFRVLGAEAEVLWGEPGQDWHAWAKERLLSTIGRALLEASNRLCPQFDGKDLLLDLDCGPATAGVSAPLDGEEFIWISEATMGGAGAIEELFRQYTLNPKRFFELALAALDPSDFEEVDAALRGFIKTLSQDSEAREIIDQARQSNGLEEKNQAAIRLRRMLVDRGFIPHHALLTAMQSRLLRPGSTPASDDLLRLLVNLLEGWENLLEIEMDIRVFAYVASNEPSVREAFAREPEFAEGQASWRASVIYSLMWPHGNAIRSRSLYYYNPFAEQAPPDASLLQDLLLIPSEAIRVIDPDWKAKVTERLNRGGTTRLIADLGDRERMAAVLLELAVNPIEVGALLLYPSVGRLRQDGSRMEVTVHLKESV